MFFSVKLQFHLKKNCEVMVSKRVLQVFGITFQLLDINFGVISVLHFQVKTTFFSKNIPAVEFETHFCW